MDLITEHYFLILGILAVVYSALCIYGSGKIKRYGVIVDAVIESYNYIRQGGKNWQPVFSFEYNGEKITRESVYPRKKADETGKTEQVYYIPGSEENVLLLDDKGTNTNMYILLGVGILSVILDFVF